MMEIFRESAKAGLISDPMAWEPYVKIRNLLIHTYNELMAKEIYEQLPTFAELAKELVENLKKKLGI
jgi:uncharacterized protein YutE (UPF0331/DUF86 family)